MTAPSGRQIYTMALDIKVPQNGPIRILEFMAGHHAGSKGYERLDGKDMSKDLILPYLSEVYSQQPVEQIGEVPYRCPLHNIGVLFGYNLAAQGGGILYPNQYPSNRTGLFQLSRVDLHFPKRYPEFTVVNADQQMLLTESNKAAQAFLIDEDPVMRKFYTPSLVVTTRYDSEMADRAAAHFNHDGFYVLKPADESQGNGVRIVAAEDLGTTLKSLLVRDRKQHIPVPGRDFWRTDINPVFVIQPYIASEPVWRRGEQYDGTLRVFATMHRDGIDQPWTVHVHDGYWKLPPQPLKANGAMGNRLISHSPQRLEKGSRIMSLFGRAATGRGAMDSAPMLQSQRLEIFPQVQEFCARLPDVMQQKSLYQRIWEHLSSNNRSRQGTGTLMAAHPIYYVGSEADPLPLDVNAFPPNYFERLKELCLTDEFGNAAASYISGLMKQGRKRPYAFPLVQILHDPDFSEKMEDREAFETINSSFLVRMISQAIVLQGMKP